jgi:stearoyl-CoA desaturase (delta-9 desaturase)
MIDWGRLQRVSLQLVLLLSFPVAIAIAVQYNLWLWLIGGFIYSRIAVTMFSVQISLHRYLAHGQYRTGNKRHVFLCWISVISGQLSPIMWAKGHMHHHKYSDTPRDIHSPVTDGLMHSSFGLLYKPGRWFMEKDIQVTTSSVARLTRDPVLLFIHKNYFYIWYALIAVSFLISWKLCLFFVLMPAGLGILNTNVVTNTLLHIKLPGSYRNYDTTDNSYNHRWILAWQLGEGLHNNHHKFPFDYDTAKKPGEYDPTAWIIKKWFKIN